MKKMADLTQETDKIKASSPEEANRALLYMLGNLQEMMSSVARGKKEWGETVDSITDPLFIHDKELKIVRCNRAYMELSGAAAFNDLIGKPYFEVSPKMEAPFKMCLKTVEEEEIPVAAVNKVYKVWFYPIPAIKYHQEYYDGSGYPEGIKGEDIPRYARIIAVADTADAMGADRPYRKGRPWATIITELKRCSGTQFDPEVVEAFLRSQ